MTARQLIPGAYERNTQTHRQPGSMGGPACRFRCDSSGSELDGRGDETGAP